MGEFTPTFVNSYDPLKAGSIDGTDEFPHDRAIVRAMNAKHKPNRHLPGDPECTIFVSRLNPSSNEQTLHKAFHDFGDIVSVHIVKDIVTGFSKCYGFIEFDSPYQAKVAVRSGHRIVIDDHEILTDSVKERVLKGWIPRRLGGGLGGKKESGQLRFGGRDRPFSRPFFLTGKNDEMSDKSDNSNSQFGHKYSEIDRRRRSRSRERRRSRSRQRDKKRRY